MENLPSFSVGAVELDAVVTTAELARRPSRPPDHKAENSALVELTRQLACSPGSILQKLVDTALTLCRAHSAGISLLENEADRKVFRWHAVAGQFAKHVWNTTTPREFSPCGTVLDRNCPMLFSSFHLHFTQFASIEPLVIECLLTPFHVDEEAVGTLWVIAHDEKRKFDAEDQRLLCSLTDFATCAYRLLSVSGSLGKPSSAPRGQ